MAAAALCEWSARHEARAFSVTDSPSHVDDALLASRIRAGDQAALGAAYDRYAAVAMAVALRVVSEREIAEDLVHDAFVAVWQKIDRFDSGRGSLRSWILAIVRNRAIDRLRAEPPRIEIGVADEGLLLQTSPNPTWERAAERLGSLELRAAVANLPAEQREAIELAYYGGHTYREIAAITGVAQGTANGRLRLALGKLRDSLGGTDAAPNGAHMKRLRVPGGDR